MRGRKREEGGEAKNQEEEKRWKREVGGGYEIEGGKGRSRKKKQRGERKEWERKRRGRVKKATGPVTD